MIRLVLVCSLCHNHIYIHQEYFYTLVDDILPTDIRQYLGNKINIFWLYICETLFARTFSFSWLKKPGQARKHLTSYREVFANSPDMRLENILRAETN